MDPLGDQQRQEKEGQGDWRRGRQLEEVVGEHEEVVRDQEEEVDREHEKGGPQQHRPRRGERCSLGLDLEGRVWLPQAPTDTGREHATKWHGPSLHGLVGMPWC